MPRNLTYPRWSPAEAAAREQATVNAAWWRELRDRESALRAEKQAQAAWVEANGGQSFVDLLTGAGRFIGRSVQFLSGAAGNGGEGNYGRVMSATRRDAWNHPDDWTFTVRVSDVAWRFGGEGGNSQPGMGVSVGLNDVKFID